MPTKPTVKSDEAEKTPTKTSLRVPSNFSSVCHTVTHMVLEGQDRKLYHAWKNAIAKIEKEQQVKIHVARVVAEDWRRILLTSKERRNAKLAKEAAALIAKQFVKGTPMAKHKFTNDVAEAILIGHYAVRVLGWVPATEDRQPAVLRYSNGKVMR